MEWKPRRDDLLEPSSPVVKETGEEESREASIDQTTLDEPVVGELNPLTWFSLIVRWRLIVLSLVCWLCALSDVSGTYIGIKLVM